jgi:hypothetical protein
MTITNETRREIMLLAWRKFRYERAKSAAYSFAEALRHAWVWTKGAPAREAAQRFWEATPVKRVLRLRSAVRSPIARSLTGQRYAARCDYEAAYTTAQVGA